MKKNREKELLAFIENSPVPVLAIKEVRKKLLSLGFKQLEEQELWSKKKGKYFVIRNFSSLIAFIIPEKLSVKSHFRIFAAHNDSPILRIRSSLELVKGDYLQVKVEPYGGLISHSWFDRELSLAGIIFSKRKGKIKEHYINIKKPLGIIPNLAIHLNRELSTDGFKVNSEKHLPVIVGLKNKTGKEMLTLFASELNKQSTDKFKIKEKDILSFECSFYNANKPIIGGLNNEFIFSSRLDDLLMVHAGLSSFANISSNKVSSKNNKKRKIIPVCAFFDHEEVGSTSSVGAASNFLSNVLERISGKLEHSTEEFYSMQSRSSILSADMAHALHPNYKEKHIDETTLKIGRGPVIKLNAKQRYSTSAKGEAEFISLCKRLNIPYQKYIHRNDIPCGSTIGPTVAASSGMTVIDAGSAMLAMHSIRETAGLKDQKYFIKLLNGFFTI